MATNPDELIARLGFNTASLPNRPLAEALQTGRSLGLRCVELLAFADYRHTAGDLAGLYFDRLSAPERAYLAEMLSAFDHVSVHAPFWDIAPFSPNPGIREESRRQLRETLRTAGGIGAETVTTHVIPRIGYELAEYRSEIIALYRELGEVAADAGVTLTIETGYPREIDAFASLVHEIDHAAVGANVDVGHLRALLSERERAPETIAGAYNGLLVEHVQSLGERVYHVHLHDVQAEGVRDHRECGTGIIDYAAFFRLLMARDYPGLVAFELEEADAVGALGRSREVAMRSIRTAATG